jgi:hypothetical protein
MPECERDVMIKRLAATLRKKTKKASTPLRSTNKKVRCLATLKASNRGGKEEESALAAEQIFLMYDAAEAKHAKA